MLVEPKVPIWRGIHPGTSNPAAHRPLDRPSDIVIAGGGLAWCALLEAEEGPEADRRRELDAAAREADTMLGKILGKGHQLFPTARLRWDADSAGDLAGYEAVWRESTTPEWQRAVSVGNRTDITLDISKDSVQFGVRAIDSNSRHSPAGSPRPS